MSFRILGEHLRDEVRDDLSLSDSSSNSSVIGGLESTFGRSRSRLGSEMLDEERGEAKVDAARISSAVRNTCRGAELTATIT